MNTSSTKLRDRIHQVVERAHEGDRASRIFDFTILSLIFINVAAVVLETVPSLFARFGTSFRLLEQFIMIIFSVEYLIRIWAITSASRFKRPVLGRIRYIFTPLAIIDLLSILPFYLPLIFPIEAGVLRVLRLFRLLRIFKAARYTRATETLVAALRIRRYELVITMMIMFIMLLFASSLLFLIENEVQPEAFSSIPQAGWWAVQTLTTVGYGDVVPITSLGKVIGSFIALLGIGIFALPSAIMASGFFEVIHGRELRDKNKWIK